MFFFFVHTPGSGIGLSLFLSLSTAIDRYARVQRTCDFNEMNTDTAILTFKFIVYSILVSLVG